MHGEVKTNIYLDEMALEGKNSSVAEDGLVSVALRKGVSGGRLPNSTFSVKSTRSLSTKGSSVVLDGAAELEKRDESEWL